MEIWLAGNRYQGFKTELSAFSNIAVSRETDADSRLSQTNFIVLGTLKMGGWLHLDYKRVGYESGGSRHFLTLRKIQILVVLMLQLRR